MDSQIATPQTESLDSTKTRTSNSSPAFIKKLPGRKQKNLFYLREKYYFDNIAALNAVYFFESELTHVEGPSAGQSLTLRPWQRSLIKHIYGWKHKSTGLRKFREVFIFIPRKNGKSFLGAGFALYNLFADNEPAPRVISAAADREQASLIYDTSRDIVLGNPRLSESCRTYKKTMAVIENGGNYAVISAEANTKHGKNLSCIIVDEVHAQPKRDLMDVLFTSVGNRLQPLKIMLTTAGFDKNSICWEYYDYAKKVANGTIIDEEFLPILFEPDPEDDWKDERTWYKANPNLGVTITEEYFRSEFKKAIDRPGYENTFKRLHLNIWTEQSTRWLPIELWEGCDQELPPIENFYKKPCWIGVDLSSKLDLTSIVLVFPVESNVYVYPFFWIPEDRIPLRKSRDRVDYDVWARQGLIETIPGQVMDYDFLRQKVRQFGKLFNVREVGCDPWNGQDFMTKLEKDGFTVVQISQGYKFLADATKELEALILSKSIIHGQNAVMKWMFGNIAIKHDEFGNYRISKKESKEKIDGFSALNNALSRYLNRENDGESIYNERGVRVLN